MCTLFRNCIPFQRTRLSLNPSQRLWRVFVDVKLFNVHKIRDPYSADTMFLFDQLFTDEHTGSVPF